MQRVLGALVLAMLFLPTVRAEDNPWRAKVADAVACAEREKTAEAYITGLDTAYRADDWRAALKLVEQARPQFGDDARMQARFARALRRGGLLRESEALADTFPTDSRDPVALEVIIYTCLQRGQTERALAAAEQLDKLTPQTAEGLVAVLSARQANNQLKNLSAMVKRVLELVDVANGYPESYFAESLAGTDEFFRRAGDEPLNQVIKHGRAPMTKAPLIGLPSCRVEINGHGPFDMILDTGGSTIISLDNDAAEQIGLEQFGEATIRGVGGKDTSQQAIIDDLKIGNICCRRVGARIFDVPDMIGDGIIGTGVFGNARMTMNFAKAELTVTPSSSKSAPGAELPLRIIGDSKLMPIVSVNGRPVVAVFDSGADGMYLSPELMRDLSAADKLRTISGDALGLDAAGVGSGAAQTFVVGPGVDVEIPGRTYHNASGIGVGVLDDTLSPILGVQSGVLIGMSAFRDMRSATIDFPTTRMWVDWLPTE